MKVADINAATSLIKDSARSPQAKPSASKRPTTPESTPDSAPESSHTTGRASMKNPIKDLDTAIKNANTTIGALEVMIRSIHSLQAQSKSYQKLAHKLQSLQSSLDPKEAARPAQAAPQTSTPHDKQIAALTSKASALKEQMQATFDSARFNEENVFTKSYADIPDSKLNAKKLAPDRLDIMQPENLSQYAKDLSEQKHYAKQAKRLVQSALDERLDRVQATDSRYEKLESSRLDSSEFKAAQGSSGITLDRVLHLLR